MFELRRRRRPSNGGWIKWLPWAAVFAGSMCASPAAAQTTCVQPAVGVFGRFGPPVWFSDPNASTDFPPPLNAMDTSIADPRWNGAWQQSFSNGSVDRGALKALHFQSNGKRFVFLSLTVNYPPIQAGAVTGNVVFVGFQNGTGTQTTLLRVNLADGTDAGTSTIKPATPIMKTISGTTGTLVATPTWFSSRVGSWVYGGGTKWTVQMAVQLSAAGVNDLNQGLDLDTGTPFKMWYEAQVAAGIAGQPAIAWYKSPAAAADVQKVNNVEGYPDPTTWGAARLATGPNDVNCPGGISISLPDIGTIGPTNNPSISILWKRTPPYPTNQLFARPLNNTGAQIPIGAIQANFRIANWGSQIGVGGTWETVPGGMTVANSLAIPVGTQPSTFYPIVLPWQLGPGQTIWDNLQNGAPSDQCLLVQLSSTGLQSLVFVNDSVRGNMSFVETHSPYSRDAEISVVNLPPIPGSSTRDVYLYVQTVNMPSQVPRGGPPSSTSPPPPNNLPRGAVDRPQLLATAADRQQVLSPLPTTDTLIANYPVMVVNVFHSTNRSTVIDGVDHPLLEQQDSFGYVVTPGSDAVTGWRYAIKGATPIAGADGWFKLDVPNNGRKTITTTIEALEAFSLTKWLGGLQWWVWLLILLLVILLAVALRQKSHP